MPRSGLQEALYRLLHDVAYRGAFLRGDDATLALNESDSAALWTVDLGELVKTSEQILSNVLRGDFDVEGGLRKSYPGVFESLREMGYSERRIMYEFLASDKFREYREIPYAGRGLCVEEAFFLFLQSHQGFASTAPTNGLLLRHEFLTVMLSILTVNRDPHFIVRSTDLIRDNGQIMYAVQRYPRQIVEALQGGYVPVDDDEVWYLYAATLRDTFVKGPVDELTLAVIQMDPRSSADLDLLGRQARMGAAELATVRDRLAVLGLVALV